MAYNARRDENQPEIAQALRQAGASVFLTHRVGGGYPDLTVGYRDETYLMEVKMPGKRLNEEEQEFFKTWKGHAIVVYSIEDALKAIGRLA